MKNYKVVFSTEDSLNPSTIVEASRKAVAIKRAEKALSGFGKLKFLDCRVARKVYLVFDDKHRLDGVFGSNHDAWSYVTRNNFVGYSIGDEFVW